MAAARTQLDDSRDCFEWSVSRSSPFLKGRMAHQWQFTKGGGVDGNGAGNALVWGIVWRHTSRKEKFNCWLHSSQHTCTHTKHTVIWHAKCCGPLNLVSLNSVDQFSCSYGSHASSDWKIALPQAPPTMLCNHWFKSHIMPGTLH